MRKYYVLPYRSYSKGAKNLAEALSGKRVKLEGSKALTTGDRVVINWGNTNNPNHKVLECKTVLNRPEDVKRCSNKLNFFKMCQEEEGLTPVFWTNKNEIPADAYPVVCRTVLSGHSGEGIVIADKPEELANAYLYVQYKKKKEEYRVHVGKLWNTDGSIQSPSGPEGLTIISLQQKKRKLDHAEPNWAVRNHQNGFIYARSEINPPDSVVSAAKLALYCSGLDFGAVDVIWNEYEGKAYVLEINTAPGLEGSTIEDYRNWIKKGE